jgi:hypothetical protein
VSTPFPLEEASQQDTGEPGWDPWKGPAAQPWYSGFGFNEDTAYLGPIERIGAMAGSVVSRGEQLLGGALHAAGEVYNAVGTPRPVGQEIAPAGEAIVQDARERLRALRPDPATTGVALQTLHGLGENIGTALAGTVLGGPAGAFSAVASTQGYDSYRTLLEQGVAPGTAAIAGTERGLLAGAGVVTPMAFGSSLIPRLATGMLSNVGYGMAGRELDSQILRRGGFDAMADQEAVFDRTQMLVDLTMGAGYGAWAHIANRLAIKAALDRDPTNLDAALTANLALRDRQGAPGIPTDPESAGAHIRALQGAVESLQRGEPVNVAGSGVEDASMLTRGGEPNPEVIDAFGKAMLDSGLLDETSRLQQMEAVLGRRLAGEPEPAAAAIPRDPKLNLAESAMEERFANQVAGDYEGSRARYAQLPHSQNGKVLNVDIARELSEDYLQDRTRSAAVHEPASWLVKRMYADALARPPGPGEDPTVLFTGGGTGAGKSTAIDNALGPDATHAQIVYDTNLNGLKSATTKIDQALSAGKNVKIAYVYRDPTEALEQGALKRATRQEGEFGSGRTVRLEDHVNTHVQSNETIRELAAHYKGDERVQIAIIDNSHGPGKAQVIPLSQLRTLAYNEVYEKASAALDQAYNGGQISSAIYHGFRAGTPLPPLPAEVGRPAGPGLGGEPGGEPQPERVAGRPDQLTDELAGPTKAGTPFLAYRAAGAESGELANRNAGNAASIAAHLMQLENPEAPQPAGRTEAPGVVNVYRVEHQEGFGPYQRFNRGETAEPGEGLVGRQAERGTIAYSFPEGGKYTHDLLGSIPVQDVLARVQARGYANFDEAGGNAIAQALRELVAEKIPPDQALLKDPTFLAKLKPGIFADTQLAKGEAEPGRPGKAQAEAPDVANRIADQALADRPNLAMTASDGSTVPAALAKLQADDELARTENVAPSLLKAAGDCFLRSGT